MRIPPLLCLASCLLLMDVRVSPLLQANERPNIVFFFSDDLTTQAISAYHTGLELPPTPHLDRLAREGMLFENSFCGNSIYAPSRATVMTGLHSHKNGIVNLSGMLDPERPTWPKALQSSGYTALFGKWHMKTKPTGFDAGGLQWPGSLLQPRTVWSQRGPSHGGAFNRHCHGFGSGLA